MQIKLFTIPILGGELLENDLNAFLRSHKILQVEQNLVLQGKSAFWCFSVHYIGGATVPEAERERIDYRRVLDDAAFERFARFREIRSQIAATEKVPPYVVFSNKELAALAKFETLTLDNMQSVEGIGPKKIEKYAQYFIAQPPDEASR